MDFGKAFSFVFEDDEWLKKIGIAALISLIPVLGQLLLLGWGFEITRRVIRHDSEPLPDWSDFGGHLMNGLQVFVIGFVYVLPVILVQGCNVVVIPFMDQGDDAIVVALSVLTACFGCLTLLYAIFAGFIIPAAIGNFAAKDELKAAFSFGDVFGLVRADFGAYALVLLGGLVAGFISSLGVIACVIGALFTYAYAIAINGHLKGQAYNQAAPGGAVLAVEDIPEPDPDFAADF